MTSNGVGSEPSLLASGLPRTGVIGDMSSRGCSRAYAAEPGTGSVFLVMSLTELSGHAEPGTGPERRVEGMPFKGAAMGTLEKGCVELSKTRDIILRPMKERLQARLQAPQAR